MRRRLAAIAVAAGRRDHQGSVDRNRVRRPVPKFRQSVDLGRYQTYQDHDAVGGVGRGMISQAEWLRPSTLSYVSYDRWRLAPRRERPGAWTTVAVSHHMNHQKVAREQVETARPNVQATVEETRLTWISQVARMKGKGAARATPARSLGGLKGSLDDDERSSVIKALLMRYTIPELRE